MHRLSKKFRFETAHRLAKGYEGKCKNIHGHSWNGEIVVECNTLNEHDFGIDFSVLKALTNEIENRLDHGIMVCIEDKDLYNFCAKTSMKMQVFARNPTCEVVSKWIFEKAIEWFSKRTGQHGFIKIYCVSIEETCTSRCEYYG